MTFTSYKGNVDQSFSTFVLDWQDIEAENLENFKSSAELVRV